MNGSKVDNAIIMAAGLASRFAPLSDRIPKGLLKVKGEVLIERQIRQLHEAGINDVTIVTGHLKDQFSYLREKYGVDIVVNDDYRRYNNTSTLMRILPRLRNTYVCSSDNYFTENVFSPIEPNAYYAASYFPGPSNEWGILTDECGRIKGIDHSPVDMWCMMGHVFFSDSFSRVFGRILESEYQNPAVRSELWESVLERNLRELEIYMRKYRDGVVLEFDSPADLEKFDPDFCENYNVQKP